MIDRETAIALAKEAGMLVLLPTNPLYKDHSLLGNMTDLERLCNLAVTHSRKDAEPVGKLVVWQHGDSGIGISFLIDNPEEKLKVNQLVYTHPPEADKLKEQLAIQTKAADHWMGEATDEHNNRVRADGLLQQALDALEDESLVKINNSVAAIRTYLEGK